MIIQNIDSWDRRTFHETLETHVDMQEIEKLGTKKVYNFAEFLLDIYSGLYKFEPEVRPIEDAPPSEQWADYIYNEISQLPEWKMLKERTRLNENAAAAAATEFCFRFSDALPTTNKHNKRPSPSGQNTYVNKNEKIIELDDLDMSAVRRTAREACGYAAEEADKTTEMISAFAYGDGTGKPQYASPSMKKEVAAKLYNNKHLQEIAKLAGRMRRIAGEKQKQKTKHGVDELTDITVGDDLARLIPAEISKLAHPMLKLDFRKRYLEKNLLQYKLRGKERLGRGPLVVCIDESGSMSGDRDVWAKAVALALLQVAQQQNRKYAMVHFDSKVTRVDKFHKKAHPADIMDAVCHFTRGGTNFEPPLRKASDIILQEKEFKNADIVFITDGSCGIDDDFLTEFNKNKKEHQFNVISVVISSYGDGCKSFSDKVIEIDSITQDDEALQAMFSI